MRTQKGSSRDGFSRTARAPHNVHCSKWVDRNMISASYAALGRTRELPNPAPHQMISSPSMPALLAARAKVTWQDELTSLEEQRNRRDGIRLQMEISQFERKLSKPRLMYATGPLATTENLRRGVPLNQTALRLHRSTSTLSVGPTPSSTMAA